MEKYQVRLMLLLILCGLLSQCTSEHEYKSIVNEKEENTIKTWYESNHPDPIYFKDSEGASLSAGFTPEWDFTSFAAQGNFSSTETELTGEGRINILPSETGLSLSQANHYLRGDETQYSFTRLVILKEKRSGEHIAFLMTVVPSLNYLNEREVDSEEFNYFKRPDGFSGLIIYHHITGEFSNGWGYIDGEIYYSLTPKADREESITPTYAGGCYNDYIIIDNYHCWYTIHGDEKSQTQCQLIGRDVIVTANCVVTPGEGNGGYIGLPGGGGGGGNGTLLRIAPTMSKIAWNASLNEQELRELENTLLDLLDICAFNSMFGKLTDKHAKFSNIRMNPSMDVPGYYNAQNKELVFRDKAAIKGAFEEEFIHLF